MKKRFTLEVMYGDADGYDTFSCITENEDEINFLTYFLENYTEDLFYFYNRPDLLRYNKTFKNNENELIKIVDNLNSLADKVCGESTPSLPEDAEKEEIHDTLSKIINFISDYFDWCMYHAGMDYYGNPQNYKIEDISDCIVMTKKETISLMKEKLGMNVVFED